METVTHGTGQHIVYRSLTTIIIHLSILFFLELLILSINYFYMWMNRYDLERGETLDKLLQQSLASPVFKMA